MNGWIMECLRSYVNVPGKARLTLAYDAKRTVGGIKREAAKLLSFGGCRISLSFVGKELHDAQELGSQGIEMEDSLDLVTKS